MILFIAANQEFSGPILGCKHLSEAHLYIFKGLEDRFHTIAVSTNLFHGTCFLHLWGLLLHTEYSC